MVQGHHTKSLAGSPWGLIWSGEVMATSKSSYQASHKCHRDIDNYQHSGTMMPHVSIVSCASNFAENDVGDY